MLGIQYLIDGFKLIFQPRLRRFAIIPIGINIILFIGLFYILKYYFGEFNHWVDHYLPHWLHWLTGLLWLVFFISFFLIILYTFVTITNLICAPFYSLLAEKVEFHLTGKMPQGQNFSATLRDAPRIIRRQLSLLGSYLIPACCLLILFFIPIIQTIAPVLWFVFNAWYITLQYVDYPSDNHKISLSQVKSTLKNNRVLSLTFGSSVLLTTMIPIINIFTGPAAVAGATKLWIELNSRD